MPIVSVRCMFGYYFLRYIAYEILNCYEKLWNIEAEGDKQWQNTSKDRNFEFSNLSKQSNARCLQAWKAKSS